VLLGAVGGPSFDSFPSHLRPGGLLDSRGLGVFANLRRRFAPALEDCSPLRGGCCAGTDVMIVRGAGGFTWSAPFHQGAPGQRSAIDTHELRRTEIERIAKVVWTGAVRRHKVTSGG
jgi:3-isopropylmalate dehydrogenase